MPTAYRPQIYLSTAAKDRERISKLYHQLQAVGFHLFWAEKDLRNRLSLDSSLSLEKEIKQAAFSDSEIVIVCLSGSSLHDAEQRAEVEWAFEAGKKVIPLFLERDTVLRREMKMHPAMSIHRLAEIIGVDLYAEGFERLIDGLEQLSGKEPSRASNAGFWLCNLRRY